MIEIKKLIRMPFCAKGKLENSCWVIDRQIILSSLPLQLVSIVEKKYEY